MWTGIQHLLTNWVFVCVGFFYRNTDSPRLIAKNNTLTTCWTPRQRILLRRSLSRISVLWWRLFSWTRRTGTCPVLINVNERGGLDQSHTIPNNHLPSSNPLKARFEKVATEFNNVWKQGLSNINTSVIQSFTNFQNGAKILHAVLTQALLYYKRFLTIWETRFGNRKTNVYPVGLQAVMVEIKKYRWARKWENGGFLDVCFTLLNIFLRSAF